TRPDVSGCIRAVERKHSTATAATARRHLSTFFAWCLADGLLGSGANPVDGTHRPADPKPRDRVLSDAELVTIWNASAGDDDHSRIVKLLILTGARRGEVGGMCWGEFDPVGNWTLPAARSKNKRQHVMALPAAAPITWPRWSRVATTARWWCLCTPEPPSRITPAVR